MIVHVVAVINTAACRGRQQDWRLLTWSFPVEPADVMRFDSDRSTPPARCDGSMSCSGSRGEPDSRNVFCRPTHVFWRHVGRKQSSNTLSLQSTQPQRRWEEMRGYRTIKYTLFIFCYFFWVSFCLSVEQFEDQTDAFVWSLQAVDILPPVISLYIRMVWQDNITSSDLKKRNESVFFT